MKALKILAIVLGAAVALLAVLAAALWLLFDPQAIKSQAEQWVSQHTGRRLEIAGDLGLVFYPRIGVAMERVSLSERDQPAVRFASVEQVRVGVPVMPLLKGRLEVEEVLLSGLDVRLVRFADGRMNIDDLAGGAGEGMAAPSSDTAPAAAPGLPRGFRLASVRVEKSRIAYQDEKLAKETIVDAVRLNLGPLSPTEGGRVEFAADLREGAQHLHAELSAAYRLLAAPLQLALDDLRIKVEGNWAGLSGLNLDWSSAKVAADPAALQISDSAVHAAVKLPGTGADLALKLPELRMELPAGKRKLAIGAYTGELKLAQSALPGGQLAVGLAGKLDADLDSLSAQGENRLRLDDSTLQATWRLPTVTPLAVTFDANLDRLNLDRYLPKKPVEAASGAPAAEPSRESPIRLPIPAGIDLAGKLRISALQVAGIKASAVDLGLRLVDRRLALAPLRLALYGGRASGRLSADGSGDQRFAAQLSLDEVNLQPLLIDAAKVDLLSGRAKIGLDVTTAGTSLSALKAGLGGAATLALRDGALKGINLARSLREIKAGVGSDSTAAEAAAAEAQTDFSDLTASFRIVRGVARNDDLLARSPFLRLTGAGEVDLPKASLDYLAKVAVVNTSTGQDGKSLDHLRGLTIPLRIRGPFAAPKFRLEVAGLAKEAAKAKLGEKLGLPAGQSAETVREEAKGRLKEKLDERLKGLFGR